ncbi:MULTISPECIES: hypothetical protein [Calothrix]|uniref:Uncharacterized protein n=2 Tax=Calothrix TaxID=1186 RepID=A0ABR8AAJ2_9CYAN|nr:MULTISPECIES: hypothetical protein [Calothrix]MBD2196455.1 hypothetical protein [Calothrix parietina FACHB-288]MBD2224650.1 hypothetical protein [Calothrix anomala FACHB-343]
MSSQVVIAIAILGARACFQTPKAFRLEAWGYRYKAHEGGLRVISPTLEGEGVNVQPCVKLVLTDEV